MSTTNVPQRNRKRIKHYHESGDVHELTFSCYGRWQLLTNDLWRRYLSQSIETAMCEQSFTLVAFVYMPEHVHLITYPVDEDASIPRLLAAIKRPCSKQIKADLIETGNPLLIRLTIREKPGKMTFRFWQAGPGYDRNLHTRRALQSAIDYVYLNPVRRGLTQRAVDWKWSSARWYVNDGTVSDPDLPAIDGMPEVI